MAKTKSTFTPVSMPGLGSEFDDVFKDDFKVEPNKPSEPAPPPATAATPAAASAPAPAAPSKTRGKTKEPRKKKVVAKASPETAPEIEQAIPPPSTSFDKEALGWFFSNSPDISRPKQLYVDRSTKETLHAVARAAKIPVGHLTENIVRWFLLSNKSEITKIIARNRDPFNHLD
ncbi:hypothetical protein LEM8419_03487 [Neolewinella maritima]|uniref:Uncharacterized protein n=1 Tax=Neolewinella maritima TaxID=1383882 RepID=A0ABN8F6Q8_9BACT|nr:hypothetical protein [Neolewinella maritima]CAH1002615.1 hypothetical protein LEM8419_03487 [Neolewinella maritima]